MEKILIFLVFNFYGFHLCCQVIPDQSMLSARAPSSFKALFMTTKGDFTIEVYRDWSPKGDDRLYQSLKTGFYNNNGIFRVKQAMCFSSGSPTATQSMNSGIKELYRMNREWCRKTISQICLV